MTTSRTFLYFTNSGTKTLVSIDTLLHGVERFRYEFDIEHHSEIGARLLAVHLRRRLSEIMEIARRDAYRDGYRDGRAKRGRKTWFCGNIAGDVE